MLVSRLAARVRGEYRIEVQGAYGHASGDCVVPEDGVDRGGSGGVKGDPKAIQLEDTDRRRQGEGCARRGGEAEERKSAHQFVVYYEQGRKYWGTRCVDDEVLQAQVEAVCDHAQAAQVIHLAPRGLEVYRSADYGKYDCARAIDAGESDSAQRSSERADRRGKAWV